jgi:hypothetical protein
VKRRIVDAVLERHRLRTHAPLGELQAVDLAPHPVLVNPDREPVVRGVDDPEVPLQPGKILKEGAEHCLASLRHRQGPSCGEKRLHHQQGFFGRSIRPLDADDGPPRIG